MKTIKIGLFGFGVVGEGIYSVLSDKPQMGVKIERVVIKHPDKLRNAPESLFSTNPDDILENEAIDLVIELIDDAEAAFKIVCKSMTAGKSVISANKKMIAENHTELIEISRKFNVSFLYEAAVCGSVPIIRNLEEYFDNDLLHSIRGIVNGSSNFILSQMTDHNSTYDAALYNAQELGYAESDPKLDVDGTDASYKLSILATHAFGERILFNQVIRKGITALCPFDFVFAREKQSVIKLVAGSLHDKNGRLCGLTALPTFVSKSSTLGMTEGVNNSVLVTSSLADEQIFHGKGAGRYPTSSAVLSDISAYKYGYRYSFKKGVVASFPVNELCAKFYFSIPKNKAFDFSLLDVIDEHYISHSRSYVTGLVQYSRLVSSGILDDPEISVIVYE